MSESVKVKDSKDDDESDSGYGSSSSGEEMDVILNSSIVEEVGSSRLRALPAPSFAASKGGELPSTGENNQSGSHVVLPAGIEDKSALNIAFLSACPFPKPEYKNKSIFDVDIDNDVPDKPWRNPGCDISDYFNYGFNEATWRDYIKLHIQMRLEVAQQGSGGRGPAYFNEAPTRPQDNYNQQRDYQQPQPRDQYRDRYNGRDDRRRGPPPDRDQWKRQRR